MECRQDNFYHCWSAPSPFLIKKKQQENPTENNTVWQRQEITVHLDQAVPWSPSQGTFSAHTVPVWGQQHVACRFWGTLLLISSLMLKSCSLKSFSFTGYFQRLCHRKDKILNSSYSRAPHGQAGVKWLCPQRSPDGLVPASLVRAPVASDKKGWTTAGRCHSLPQSCASWGDKSTHE